ncbi:MAG: hypothetical protein ACP5JH_09400 [Bacteroidota bacterium]
MTASRRKRALLFAFATALVLALNIVQLTRVDAKQVYMAGVKDGDICHCPVVAGDCICAINL